MIIKICPICNKEFKVFQCQEQRKTCSRKCMSIFQTGENNPNYGKKWNKAQRDAASELMLKRYKERPELLEAISKVHKGKVLSEEHKAAWKAGNKWLGRKHKPETLKKLSAASKSKFTEDYKSRQRKLRENNGTWIPLSEKTDYEIYFKESQWNQRIFDKITNEDQLRLLTEHGVFHLKNNKKGVVRDHAFSRWDGFWLEVFPEIIRHPANCRILKHSNNVSKRSKSSTSLDSLIQSIKEFSLEWHEQELTLTQIERYENGERWKRKGG